METTENLTSQSSMGNKEDDVASSKPTTPGPAARSTVKPHKPLLKRYITLSAAQAEEEDMRAELQYAKKKAEFYNAFADRQKEIQELVAFHCGLTNPDLVQVPEMFGKNNELVWVHGSFNMCIPVRLNAGLSLPAKLGLRVPLPYKLGEETFPGNAEEKVRSEAATYIWVNENCPDVPIPKLRGFGVTGGLSALGEQFCQLRFAPLWQRLKWYFWRIVRPFYRSHELHVSQYVPRKRTALSEYSYILMDWIEDDTTQMLSDTFFSPHTDFQTENLYRDMSRIMISLAKIPQSRIGSWTVNNQGQISLTNRPMFCYLHQLENWSIPTDIPRGMTYASADSLYLDVLGCHDNRLRFQANAAFDEIDARLQAKDLVLMRALLHKFTNRCERDGPFIMQFTDMHQSNILVDKDWNIKHIIDLEWTCSLPLGFLRPPFWLTGMGVDEIEGPEYDRFKACYETFVEVFEQEEASSSSLLLNRGVPYSPATSIKTALKDGQYWYFSALHSPKGLFNIFRAHLEPMFDKVPKDTLREGISPFWTPGMTSFVDFKLNGYTRYLQEVHDVFNSNQSGTLRLL
ncbi:hypothetical protein FQN54_009824 [Arachnomyces sp. PD_36]|nr:hypothetical protein FQN54_009824 [Arachnomyces sp. PD_36]